MIKVRVRIGGLMRCCLATLDRDTIKRTDMPKEDDVLPCDHCSSSMVFHDNAWEWNRPKDLPA